MSVPGFESAHLAAQPACFGFSRAFRSAASIALRQRVADVGVRKRCIAEGRNKNGRTPAAPFAAPDGKTQRNFTDPDTPSTRRSDGSSQGYIRYV